VNTQFQYIDVGVNIDITPTVHGSNEVTLKVSLDISAVDSEVSIGGIQQPVIGQRRIEHTIRLKEGEVNLLGGLLEDSSTKSLSGYPGLMSVPILKYLFGNLNTDHRQTETVFVLIPHIVRIQDVNPGNRRQLDVGTSNNIDLHLAKTGKPETAPVALPSTPGVSTGPFVHAWRCWACKSNYLARTGSEYNSASQGVILGTRPSGSGFIKRCIHFEPGSSGDLGRPSL
jgi:general secretion pathway protein D